MNDDDRLLAELGEAVRAAGAVPEGFRRAGRAAFAWRTVDAELAELVESDASTGVRAAPARRTFRLAAGPLTVEVELSPDALAGQAVEGRLAGIELEEQDGTARAAAVDELGWFLFVPGPAGRFRLRLRPAGGAVVVSPWTRP